MLVSQSIESIAMLSRRNFICLSAFAGIVGTTGVAYAGMGSVQQDRRDDYAKGAGTVCDRSGCNSNSAVSNQQRAKRNREKRN